MEHAARFPHRAGVGSPVRPRCELVITVDGVLRWAKLIAGAPQDDSSTMLRTRLAPCAKRDGRSRAVGHLAGTAVPRTT